MKTTETLTNAANGKKLKVVPNALLERIKAKVVELKKSKEEQK